MKYLIVLFLLLCSMMSNAQVLDRSIVVNGKGEVNNDYVFHDGDSLSFKVNNNANADSLEWDLGVKYKGLVNGCLLYNSSTKKRVIGDSFSFSITPRLFRPLIDWFTECIEYDNDSSVYTHVVIHLYKKTVVLDSMSIYLNILPSRPKFVKAELKGKFDYAECWYQQSAELSLTFTSHMMKGCNLERFISDSIFANEFPVYNWTGKLVLPMDYLEKYCVFFGDDDLYSLKYNNADWGEFYKILSYNDYGGVESEEAINTTKLINDSNVTSALKQYYNEVTKVNNLSSDNSSSISYHNNRIYISNNNNSIPIMIYNPDGRLILRSTILKSIEVSSLPHGLYFVKVVLDSGKCQTCKIIIR